MSESANVLERITTAEDVLKEVTNDINNEEEINAKAEEYVDKIMKEVTLDKIITKGKLTKEKLNEAFSILNVDNDYSMKEFKELCDILVELPDDNSEEDVNKFKDGLYEKLPRNIKLNIASEYRNTKGSGFLEEDKNILNELSYNLLISIKDQVELTELFDTFDRSVNKEIEKLSEKNINKLYSGMYVKSIYDKINSLKEVKDSIDEANIKPETNEKFGKVIEQFENALHYNNVLKKISNKPSIVDEFITEMNKNDKYFIKQCNKFKAKYNNTKFKLPDINDMLDVLSERFTDISIEYIKTFILILLKSFKRVDIDDMEEHALVYYSLALPFIYVLDEEDRNIELEERLTEIYNNIFTTIVKSYLDEFKKNIKRR